MQVISSLAEWRRIRQEQSFEGQSVGLVPTMGNLHDGHLSLLTRARTENDLTVLSIFVNATQFNDRRDLENYPRTPQEDLAAAHETGVDFVICPTYDEVYPDNFRFVISEKELSRRFCGAHRPGHFDGVLTVVLKLLQLVKPTRAYFGEKDYQQFILVRDMAEAFFLDTQIIPCPLVRDTDGLALSSRNRNLTPDQRRQAASFPRILQESESAEEAIRKLTSAGFEVDYVEEFEGRRLAAVKIGSVRLIDNVLLK